MADKPIPLDLDEYEKIVIYNSLFDISYLETIIEHVKPSYFKDKDTKTIFTIVNSYYEEFQKTPTVTEIKAHLPSEEDKQALKRVILSFNNIDKEYDKEVLLKNTERWLREKAILNTYFNTSIEVQSGEIDSTKLLKKFEEACNVSLVDNLGLDYLESIDEHVDELLKTEERISSGWKWLDKNIGGGFLKDGRALYIFYGSTNVGKSIFLGNMATNILNQDKTVVLITLEMPEHVYAKRISACLSKIPSNDLKLQIDPLKSKLNQYKVKNSNSKLIIKEFPTKGVTVLGIKTYVEKLIRKGIKPDVIILDYLNLIAPPNIGKNSYESIKEITEYVRALTYKFECPIISATQTNRTGYKNGMPDLETTSESMGLAHTADAQFPIWTDEQDFELGIIHMGITKNRFGSRGIHTQLKIDYPTLSISELDEVVFNYTLKGKSPTNLKDDSNPNITDILSSAENYSDNDEIS
jgi:replicative DNA helicase